MIRYKVQGIKAPQPFDCSNCDLQEERNCGNLKKLACTSIEDFKSDDYKSIKDETKIWTIGLTRLYECPLTWFTDDSLRLYDISYLINNSGQLLFNGSWSEQPAWVWQAYLIYQQEINKTDGN